MTDESTDDELDEFDALRSVGHGAVISVGGVGLQKALLFLTNLVLTAGMSVSLYGVYAFGWRLTKLLLRFAPFGAPSTLVRMLPEYREDTARQNRILGLAYLTAFVTTLAISAAVFLSAERINAITIDHAAFPLALRLFAVLLPFEVLVRLLGFLFRALERIEYNVVLLRVVRPGVRLIAVSVALALGYSVMGVIGAVAIAAAAVAVFAVWLSVVRTELDPKPPSRSGEAISFYNFALPNTFRTVGQLFRSRVDVLLIGWLLTASAAGIYNVALFLTSIIAIPLIAFNQLFAPVASKLYSEGEIEKLSSIYSTVTRLVFTATVVIAVTLFVYREPLLALFGAEYTAGTVVLAVFVLGRVVANAVGATGWLLLMTDHQYLRLADSWLLAILNVAFSYYFVLEYGLVGAALGTAGSMAVVNLLRLAQLWYLEGLQPFTARFAKPLGAGLGMAAAMTSLKSLLSGAALLVVGTGVGVHVFAGLLYLFGVERTDRVLAGSLYQRYRSASVLG